MRKPSPSGNARPAPHATLVILNRQRVRAVNLRQLRRLTRALLDDLLNGGAWELGLNLINADEMARVNETFLQHPGSTDVITFDHAGLGIPTRQTPYTKAQPSLHGELFICVSDAVTQAREFRTTWQSELVRYVVHGVLHLRGFDDRTARDREGMKREEDRLVRELSGRFEIAKLGTRNSEP